MTIINHASGQYIAIPKTSLKEPRLYMGEIGLLATLYSFPEDEVITMQTIREVTSDDDATIKSALDGLIKKGLIESKYSFVCGEEFFKIREVPSRN